MPDVLLTHGYFLSEDEKELEIMKPYPPLGLLYISAYLQRAASPSSSSTPPSRPATSWRRASPRSPAGSSASTPT